MVVLWTVLLRVTQFFAYNAPLKLTVAEGGPFAAEFHFYVLQATGKARMRLAAEIQMSISAMHCDREHGIHLIRFCWAQCVLE